MLGCTSLLLFTLAAAPRPPAGTALASTERLAAVLSSLSSLESPRERIAQASKAFLGAPYVRDPLGEGPGKKPDSDPLVRADAFDCATYVETVLALARSSSLEELGKTLEDIRYDGEVAFDRRHPLFASQWLPANVRKGYVRDITEEVAGERVQRLTKEVTLASWKARKAATWLELPEERIPVGSLAIPYVPLGEIRRLGKRIPSGTLFMVVREDRPNIPFVETHVGFVIQTDRGPVVRHAARALKGVADEDLPHFVGRNERYGKWRVLGFRLLEPVGKLSQTVSRPEPEP